MSIFKCKMCGGTIEFEQGATIGVCDSCGTKQTLPRLDDDRRLNLYDRANHFRRNNEFDKAAGIYEQILNEDTSDSEAYWSLVLCRYGIEYVEDPLSHKRVPTVNRAQYTSIFDDDNYKSAIQYADYLQRTIYEEEANAINEIQKGILAISQKEDPFDIFICYKETDNNGRRTPDSVLANDLYHQLTNEGFKVFFSRITLEDKLGTAYEPYIFAALNSAKVMVVLGTKPEYFNAVWVKNEWSRYLALVRQSGGKKVLIPAYRDMDPYDLPEEFSHLQAQDMSKLGFMQDLIRGIKKLTGTNEAAQAVKETTVIGNNANIAPLLKRAFMFLEDGEWSKADDFCEQVLNQDPENPQAYVGKLMAELNVNRQGNLSNCDKPFDGSSNFQKAVRFGDDITRSALFGYIKQINDRNENKRIEGIYSSAVRIMNASDNESEFIKAAEIFKTIPGFKDADTLADICFDKAEVCRKDNIYMSARSLIGKLNVSVDNYKLAIERFEEILDWKDSKEQILICKQKIDEINEENEKARLAATEKKKKLRRAVVISSIVTASCAIIAAVFFIIVLPMIKYNNAVKLYHNGQYEEAIDAYEKLNGYRDSEQQIERCETAIKEQKHDRAMELIDAEDYDAAYVLLEEIEENETIVSNKYDRAIKLIESGDYDTAYALLEQIGKNELIASSKYDRATKLIESGDYDSAYALLEQVGKNELIASSKYDRAVEYINSGDIESAYLMLDKLNYKDSNTLLKSIKLQYEGLKISNSEIGSYVNFGTYEQDNNSSNGKEDIEWLVLAKEDNRVLLISKYALDCQPFNRGYDNGGDTWKNCSLRKWLNDTFLNHAFSSDEQKHIVDSTITADKNPKYNTSPGGNTIDKVFLLSITEISSKYVHSETIRQCKPTSYCCAQGALVNDYAGSKWEGNCVWWLRTPGHKLTLSRDQDIAVVNIEGHIDYEGYGPNSKLVSVRPAIWIDLEKLL